VKTAACITAILIATAFTLPMLYGQEDQPLEPLMAVKGEVFLQDDFEEPHELDREVWQQRQHTRWTIADGVLTGLPSTQEYQEQREAETGKRNSGSIPRLRILGTPRNYIIQFDFKIDGGHERHPGAFFEFGHHKTRLNFGPSGVKLTADHGEEILFESEDFVVEPGQWYSVIAEIFEDQVLIRFKDGPTMYGRSEHVGDERIDFSITGPPRGQCQMDNLSVWEVQEQLNPQWEEAREQLRS